MDLWVHLRVVIDTMHQLDPALKFMSAFQPLRLTPTANSGKLIHRLSNSPEAVDVSARRCYAWLVQHLATHATLPVFRATRRRRVRHVGPSSGCCRSERCRYVHPSAKMTKLDGSMP